jgi:hypothetical protein
MEQVEIHGRLSQSPLLKHELVPVALPCSIEVRIVTKQEQLRKRSNVNRKRQPGNTCGSV